MKNYENLILIGQMMSNICFNASQTLTAMSNKPEEIERLKTTMREMYQDWDAEKLRLGSI